MSHLDISWLGLEVRPVASRGRCRAEAAQGLGAFLQEQRGSRLRGVIVDENSRWLRRRQLSPPRQTRDVSYLVAW